MQSATQVSAELSLAPWTHGLQQSALQSMLTGASRPEILSLALGLPALELFPRHDIGRVAQSMLAEDSAVLQYGPPSAVLRAQIVELMALRGVRCTPQQVLITSGAQQGLNLLSRLLLPPGGSVLVEELTYTGLLQAVQPLNPQIYTVPTSPTHGIDVDSVEAFLRCGKNPAFLYISSESHNPLGASLELGQRKALADLAQNYGVAIIEDDAYGFLRYDRCLCPPVRALEEQFVLYVGSFSKIQAPALRVGWIVAPESIHPHLEVLKESTDINTGTLAQRILCRYLQEGRLPEHLNKLQVAYRERRDAMLSSLEEHFDGLATWNVPSSGVFIWLELNVPINTLSLLPHTLATEKVAFIPGQAFSADGRPRALQSMRLNFSYLPPELLKEAVARLARSVRTFANKR